MKTLAPFLALLAVLGLNAAFTPGFLDFAIQDGRLYAPLVDIVHRAVPVALLALGMTLVIGTGGIDLSVGSVMAVCGVLAALGLTQTSIPVALLIPLVLVAGFGIGLLNGALVRFAGLQPIVATLVLMVGGRGLALELSEERVVGFENPAFASLASGSILSLPVTLWILLGAALATILLVRRTRIGLWLQATGDNPSAAELCGLPVSRLILLAYGLCAGLAALAGMIGAADIRGADPNSLGLWLELDAILAVVIGGTPLIGGRMHVVGTLLGALLLQSITTGVLMLGIAPELALILKAVAVLIVCALQSGQFGIEGSKSMSRGRGGGLGWGIQLLRALPTMLAFGALIAIGAYSFEGLISWAGLGDLLVDHAVLGLTSLGALYVILSGGIDLSVGSLLALASVAFAMMLGAGVPLVLAAPAMLLGCFVAGLAKGSLVGRLGLPPFLVTLAGMFLYRGLALLWTREALPMDDELLRSLSRWYLPLGELRLGIPALLWIAWLLLTWHLLSGTRLGRALYAIGGDERAAFHAGIRVARVKALAHALAGISVGLAALARVLIVPSGDPRTGIGLELEAIAAVVVGGAWLTGGVGNAFGAAMGVLIFGLIETLIDWHGGFGPGLMRVAIAALLLGFVLIQRLQQR
jgi:ribose/xylose/arabinose/galactoside ABC-type transport system permease subunit